MKLKIFLAWSFLVGAGIGSLLALGAAIVVYSGWLVLLGAAIVVCFVVLLGWSIAVLFEDPTDANAE